MDKIFKNLITQNCYHPKINNPKSKIIIKMKLTKYPIRNKHIQIKYFKTQKSI